VFRFWVLCPGPNVVAVVKDVVNDWHLNVWKNTFWAASVGAGVGGFNFT
jgi:hypothetical protein